MGLMHGPLFIDDSYITFRYAANIARGHGFVFYQEPILGTTAPFYCLLLALAKMAGIPIGWSALGIGVISSSVAPLLCWRLGVRDDKPVAGFIGSLLLCLCPYWWLHSKTGMETSLAGLLSMTVIFLEVRDRSTACGVASGLLILTRPEAATLPALIFLVSMVRDRDRALRFAAAAAGMVIPWIIFAAIYFGSPIPHSLPAKRLIHVYSRVRILIMYLSWFTAVKTPAGMIVVSALWLAGCLHIIRSRRSLLAMALWPPPLGAWPHHDPDHAIPLV
jgi:predicted membrane-bound dolichyl-phosphate-mannose-protein mannosyltransferase